MSASTQAAVRYDEDGNQFCMYFVPDSGTSGPGTFSATYFGSGDPTPASPFVPVDQDSNPLTSDGSGFDFDYGPGSSARIFLAMVAGGDTEPSIWYSTDGLVSFTRM